MRTFLAKNWVILANIFFDLAKIGSLIYLSNWRVRDDTENGQREEFKHAGQLSNQQFFQIMFEHSI
jgi:hypothetical protein